jgi:hypothetical protein
MGFRSRSRWTEKPVSFKPGTQWRVRGPTQVGELTVFTVHEILPDGTTGRQMGRPCFSWEEACDRVEALRDGRIKFFMGGHGFELKKVGG